ncbi:hypothetical protein BFR40_04105 [Brochothrix thermosphacta]|uniref:DUF916 and DUF3324 domain-containing protein n=1 Tax=Brochothrix thermosphacta TaxID=2756 RepID=UPI00083F76ED|nr:DUF916 and DUF3324 domain-containing protein [Brochothrix thermosphacta]ODJ53808.1 hypothetical protein BFR40_04105 [Brochothrix thermosphacta]
MKKMIYAIMVLTILLGFNLKAEAASMDYGVKSILPENQLNKNVTYYDLKMKPGETQQVELLFENNATETVTLNTKIHTASTNANGVIDYSRNLKKQDESMKYQIADYVKGPKTVTLKAKETRKVAYTITMPKHSFDGILLGGFHVSKEKSKAEEKKEQGQQIKNEFAYVIGLKLTETNKKIKPELKLIDVKPALENYHTVVKAFIQNPTASIISDLKIEAQVTKKDSKTVLHEIKKENYAMAPNTNFGFAIPWDNQELKPGKYTVSVKAEDKTKEKWEFTRDFEIKKEAESLNKEAVDIEKPFPWGWTIAGGIVLLAIIVGAVYFIIKKRRKN